MSNKIQDNPLPTVEDYQKLIEDLRVRLNVLNASVFLLEERMPPRDMEMENYLNKINSELEIIRKMIITTPKVVFQKN
ncbi:MAG TPA: hypothetical protein ENJ15_01295 [Caldithrix abyssi]|uniref:Uncharacterized protein n=1 Tax=Caldithrix abyssi TaxID=187145 RepID=A0A7V5RN69_CALAY|nr:hypothetical protein [Caldithrix abyssi]